MTHPAPTPPTTPSRRARASAGFLLNELLISLGIFAIGMAALASLFPVAAILQRETAQEVFAGAAAQSAEAIVNANGLTYDAPGAADRGDLGQYHPTAASTRTESVPLLNLTGFPANKFPQTLRALPSSQVNTALANPVKHCDDFWLPFIQDVSGDPANPNWVMRVFVLSSDSRATYAGGGAGFANPASIDADNFPRVQSVAVSSVSGNTFNLAAAHDLEPGDIFMDANGIDYVVGNVPDNTTIEVLFNIPITPATPGVVWFAPRYNGKENPAQRILTVDIDVTAP